MPTINSAKARQMPRVIHALVFFLFLALDAILLRLHVLMPATV